MGKCKKRGIVILKYREETRCLLDIEGNLKSQRCNLIGCLYAISIDKGHRCFSVWQKKKKNFFCCVLLKEESYTAVEQTKVS